MDQQRNNPPTAEEIARMEAQAVAAMQRGEQPAQPEAPRQEADPEPPTVPDFVPYVDDVPAPEPDATEEPATETDGAETEADA